MRRALRGRIFGFGLVGIAVLYVLAVVITSALGWQRVSRVLSQWAAPVIALVLIAAVITALVRRQRGDRSGTDALGDAAEAYNAIELGRPASARGPVSDESFAATEPRDEPREDRSSGDSHA